MEFLEGNNILTNAQNNFRHGFSTLTQLSEFVHDISSALDSGNQVDAIFIDFAFDSVPHTKLLSKLNAILIKPASCHVDRQFPFRSFQYVSYNTKKL